MNQGTPEIFKDRDYQDSMKSEMDRGVDPEILDKMGYPIYGETQMPIVEPDQQFVVKTETAVNTEPVIETPPRAVPKAAVRRHLQELPGRSRGRGRVNRHDQPVNAVQARSNMTVEAVDRQSAINKIGAAEGLAILRSKKPPKI